MSHLVKTFEGDFDKLLNKLIDGEHFAFSRFSDGELYMLQGQRLKIGGDEVIVKGKVQPQGPGGPPEADHKDFYPKLHEPERQTLENAFLYQAENYYVGVSCRCCTGQENFDWQLDLLGGDRETLTWANLFINSNYPKFVKKIIPELRKRALIIVCNEQANLQKCDLAIKKDFRVSSNALITGQHLVDEMLEYMKTQDKGQTLVFAASAMGNVLIHRLAKEYPDHTYLDVGSALNYHIHMHINRGYLEHYWLSRGNMLQKRCIW